MTAKATAELGVRVPLPTMLARPPLALCRSAEGGAARGSGAAHEMDDEYGIYTREDAEQHATCVAGG